jgi:hypothetical protein
MVDRSAWASSKLAPLHMRGYFLFYSNHSLSLQEFLCRRLSPMLLSRYYRTLIHLSETRHQPPTYTPLLHPVFFFIFFYFILFYFILFFFFFHFCTCPHHPGFGLWSR